MLHLYISERSENLRADDNTRQLFLQVPIPTRLRYRKYLSKSLTLGGVSPKPQLPGRLTSLVSISYRCKSSIGRKPLE
jgi:hypothetical protein